MEKDLVFNMENIFYTVISQIHEYHKIQQDLRWYERINPIIGYKMKLIEKKITERVEYILDQYKDIDKKLMFDFQSMYLANIDIFNYEPMIIVSKYRDEQRGDIFYQMCFKHRYLLDIVSDTIIVGDTAIGFQYSGEFHIPENTDTLKNITSNIKETIYQYFIEFLSKK